jgi:hypothetical protein
LSASHLSWPRALPKSRQLLPRNLLFFAQKHFVLTRPAIVPNEPPLPLEPFLFVLRVLLGNLLTLFLLCLPLEEFCQVLAALEPENEQ